MPENNTDSKSMIGIILERIEQLKTDVHTLSGKFDAMSNNMQQFQLTYTAEHIKVVEQAVQAHTRLDVHERRLVDLETTVKSLQLCSTDMTNQVKQMKAILIGIIALIAPLVVTLAWQLLTHQVTLVTP